MKKARLPPTRTQVSLLRVALEAVRKERDERTEERDHAEHQLRRMDGRLLAYATAAEAADAFLNLGDVRSAQAVLTAIRMSWIDRLRDQVSREPGGVNYEKKED